MLNKKKTFSFKFVTVFSFEFYDFYKVTKIFTDKEVYSEVCILKFWFLIENIIKFLRCASIRLLLLLVSKGGNGNTQVEI